MTLQKIMKRLLTMTKVGLCEINYNSADF